MRLIRPLVTFLVCAALATSPSASHHPVGTVEKPSAVPARPDAATVRHVLNRIGYGPRPGDVERVREIGLAAYIDQQLRPERLADEGMSARLAGFDTLGMSTRELADRYFIPAMMERRERQKTRASQGEPGQPPPPEGMAPDIPRQKAHRRDA